MKTTFANWFSVLVSLLLVTIAHAQPRDGGQLVVPRGWENEDSVRFGIYDLDSSWIGGFRYGTGTGYNPSPWGDSIQANFQHFWGYEALDKEPEGNRKGFVAMGSECGGYTNLTYAIYNTMQRIFYPSPQRPLKYSFDNGYWWRYNDINIINDSTKARWHNNTYDANDISPYAEYDSNTSLVLEAFETRRFKPNEDTTILVGNHGRLILGYSDNRLANEMYKTYEWYPFRAPDTAWQWDYIHPEYPCGETTTKRYLSMTEYDPEVFQDSIRNLSGHGNDTVHEIPVIGAASNRVRAFSVNLEFNIDTTAIIMDETSLPMDSVPLLRLQVLYKKGREVVNSVTIPGWEPLPFVPFRNKAGADSIGWYEALDKTITKSVYRTLDNSWRAEDRFENGSPAHSNWKFKQLHIIIPADSMIAAMKRLITTDEWVKTGEYGGGKLDYPLLPISQFIHQDSVVNIQSNDEVYTGDHDLDLDATTAHYLEIRLLSTYRSTVRIRSLSWQDTTVDKFLFRERVNVDSTFALKPDGTGPSFYDDSIRAVTNGWAAQIPAGVQREMHVNDVDLVSMGSPLAGLVDWHLYRTGLAHNRVMNIHIREQEFDGWQWSQHFRRDRMSHDGKPPSLWENQTTVFYSNRFRHGLKGYNDTNYNKIADDIFPHDYMFYALPMDSTLTWPTAEQDSMVGLIIGRLDTIGDGLNAYRQYTQNNHDHLGHYLRSQRASARTALWHPRERRHALQAEVQGWGIFQSGATYNSPYSWTFPLDNVKRNSDGDTVITPNNFRAAYNERPTTPEETQAMMYGSLANGVSSFSYAQVFDKNRATDGAPGAFGFLPDADTGDTFQATITTSYNFGHQYSPYGSGSWTKPHLNDANGNLPDFYIGYGNSYRAYKRILSRINRIYDTNAYNLKYPFKRFTWLDAYSAHRALPTSGDTSSRPSWRKAFLKVDSTTPVKRWSRDSLNLSGRVAYIDSVDGSGNLVSDSLHRTYVEVGLFEDSAGVGDGLAVMVVNTRLWPSLRDAKDTAYYNDGLDSLSDHARSTLGDIDTRKVWLNIDTTALLPHQISRYYVVRDVWHHDTTYLVHRDSSFGIYMKPGEARLLYIEKSIAINVAKNGRTLEEDFGYNNGRRVAEIMNGLQSVVTYVRDGNLMVSYPGKGIRFEGYNQRSAGENITTGFELCIDSSGTCTNPSIASGMNDTSVAIVYRTAENGGRIKVAFQPKPHDPWQFALYTGKHFNDPDVITTPVITPYAQAITTPEHNDSLWWVAVPFKADSVDTQHGIAALLVKVTDTTAGFVVDPSLQYFHKDPVGTLAVDRSQFPTIASRPLVGNMFPMRLAWQKAGRIFYNRYRDIGATVTSAGLAEVISDGLPSKCYNFHPSIAISSREYKDPSDLVDTGGLGGQIPQAAGVSKDIKLHDYVVWESRIHSKHWKSKWSYWPVMRQRIQYLNYPLTPGFWSEFSVYVPRFDTIGTEFHWPNITAASRSDLGSQAFLGKIPYHEVARIAWHDDSLNTLEFVHLRPSTRRSYLLEGGRFPSMPLATYDVRQMTDSSKVQQSVVFAGLEIVDEQNKVRITNGWFPWIGTRVAMFGNPTFRIGLKPVDTVACNDVADWDGDISNPIIIPNGAGPTVALGWLEIDPQLGAFPGQWPVVPYLRVELRTQTFSIAPADSVVIPRQADTIDLTAFRTGLVDSNDYVMAKITLRKAVDSSWVATIDSAVITLGSYVYPGSGLDASFALYKHPLGGISDTVFLALEVLRGNAMNNFIRGVMIFDTKDSIGPYAFKKAPKTSQSLQRPHSITLDIRPNPTDYTATASISAPSGSHLHVELFDVGGRKLMTIFDRVTETGNESVALDGTSLPAGSYFVRIQSGTDIVTKRLELVR